MIEAPIIRSMVKQVLAIGIVAYLVILCAVFAMPHLPLANKQTFPPLLRAQMTIDHEREVFSKNGSEKKHLLLIGSSVVERGIDDDYLDTLMSKAQVPFFCTNSASGGSFANENIVTFRAMLEKGLQPNCVIYGTFFQEFNGNFLPHTDMTTPDTLRFKLKEKTVWNALRYGPSALSPILDASSLHIYLFSMNHAFRTVQYPNALQRLSFGENMYKRDSSYRFIPAYLDDLKAIYEICKERHIPFALFNTPVRPKIESVADLPYFHKREAYLYLEQFAKQENIPIWNFDMPGSFSDNEFLDTYHLNANGAHKMTQLLADKIAEWQKGIIEQDVVTGSADSIVREVKDSLVRTVFHF
jgi:hypothetical protein